jgi:hypothetical protein
VPERFGGTWIVIAPVDASTTATVKANTIDANRTFENKRNNGFIRQPYHEDALKMP